MLQNPTVSQQTALADNELIRGFAEGSAQQHRLKQTVALYAGSQFIQILVALGLPHVLVADLDVVGGNQVDGLGFSGLSSHLPVSFPSLWVQNAMSLP
jgi:hypothetical protein